MLSNSSREGRGEAYEMVMEDVHPKKGGYMNPDELLELNIIVFERLISSANECGNLVFTQTYREMPKIREPEVRYVYCKILEEKNYTFGLEVPTKEDYAFTGKKSRSALTDLSIFGEKREKVNIEFKEGQPKQDQVDKDIEKLIREQDPGIWFHIFQTRNPNPDHSRGTLERLIHKLNKSISKYEVKGKSWIQFIIIVKGYKELWFLTKQKRDLNRISLADFDRRELK